jgi:hypothetical protein
MFSEVHGGTLMHLTLLSLVDTEWPTSELPLPLVSFDQLATPYTPFPQSIMDATPNPTIYSQMEGSVNEAPDMSAYRQPWDSESPIRERFDAWDSLNVALPDTTWMVRGKKRKAIGEWQTHRDQATWQRTTAIGNSLSKLKKEQSLAIEMQNMTAILASDAEDEEKISRLLRMFHISESNIHVSHRAQYLIHRLLSTLSPGGRNSANRAACRGRTFFGWEQ